LQGHGELSAAFGAEGVEVREHEGEGGASQTNEEAFCLGRGPIVLQVL
jgi:hypothetical protein